MRSQRIQNKSKNKVYLCSLCEFVALSQEELENHIKMSHEESDDLEYELEFIVSKEKKAKTLKNKAIEQLKLLVIGKDFHNEYIGWCTTKYYTTLDKNKIILMPYSTIC